MERNLEELFGLINTKPEDPWTHCRGYRSHPIGEVLPPVRRTAKPPAIPAVVAGFISVVLYGALRGRT